LKETSKPEKKAYEGERSERGKKRNGGKRRTKKEENKVEHEEKTMSERFNEKGPDKNTLESCWKKNFSW